MFGPKSDEEKLRKIMSSFASTMRNFPGLPTMTVDEAHALQQEGNAVLVDVRSPEEQAVSMIDSAVTADAFTERTAEYQGKKVVTYCTVGYRSGMFAQQLRRAGIDAYNLDGAILAWVHGPGTLTDREGPTRKVHVFGRKFDLLPKGYEAVW